MAKKQVGCITQPNEIDRKSPYFALTNNLFNFAPSDSCSAQVLPNN